MSECRRHGCGGGGGGDGGVGALVLLLLLLQAGLGGTGRPLEAARVGRSGESAEHVCLYVCIRRKGDTVCRCAGTMEGRAATCGGQCSRSVARYHVMDIASPNFS